MEGADGPGRSPPDRGSEEKSDGSKESGSETSLQGHTEQPPPEKDSLSSDSTKGHLSILEGVRRETSFPSLHRLGRETETSDSVNPTTPMKALGASVSMQTEASWLYKQLYKKSTLSEELSSLDILCDLEFKVDFVRLFKKSLCTLPSVGPPTLLAYRPESSRENIQIKLGEDCVPRCEYCGNLLKLFPSFEDVCPPTQDYKSKFCCERNQELYEFILNERKNLEAAWSSPIAIGPHESRGNESERLLAKERAYQRQQERQMAKQLAFLATEQTTLPDYSSELDTISYLLSREPPSPSSRTLMPGEKAAKPKEERIYYSITCCDFTVVSGKDKHKYSGRAVSGPSRQQGENMDLAKHRNVVRSPRPTASSLHIPEPARGGQDPGPGQDSRVLPRHGAASKIQRGNKSTGQCSRPAASTLPAERRPSLAACLQNKDLATL
ncbi:glutamate-rich protein 6 isoform X10 [Struthio camelus]|uniref:glutamate-rich protein 6 isoform X10 n=1 Tax=Struthio camelus TaxID=8801 RepID=UPI003603F73D